MCYKTKEPDSKKQVEFEFGATFIDPLLFEPGKQHFGFEHPYASIILDIAPDKIDRGYWGLIPGWAANKDRKEFFKTANTLNAKIETVEKLKSYQNYTDNRCLIPVQAFYEYKHIPIAGTKKVDKILHELTVPEQKPFAIAGLYSMINNIPTYTILTTEANTLMAEIHNSAKRMPVVLAKEEQKLWLQRESLEPFHNRTEIELIAKRIGNQSNELQPSLF